MLCLLGVKLYLTLCFTYVALCALFCSLYFVGVFGALFWRPDVVVVRFRVEELPLAFFLDVACSVRVFLRCCAAALLSWPHNNVTERMMMYNNDRYTVVRRWG